MPGFFSPGNTRALIKGYEPSQIPMILVERLLLHVFFCWVVLWKEHACLVVCLLSSLEFELLFHWIIFRVLAAYCHYCVTRLMLIQIQYEKQTSGNTTDFVVDGGDHGIRFLGKPTVAVRTWTGVSFDWRDWQVCLREPFAANVQGLCFLKCVERVEEICRATGLRSKPLNKRKLIHLDALRFPKWVIFFTNLAL